MMARQSFSRSSLVLLASLIILAAAPAKAKPRDLTQYPLRVHIFQSQWNAGGTYWGHGYGIANLFDGQTVRGFNFVYECPIQYAQSIGNEAYVAKWKKPEKSLEIVGSQTGNSAKSDSCEFTVTLHDFVYDMQNGTIATFSPEQYRIRIGMALPTTSTVDKNPDHYPLRLEVLKVDWEPAVNGSRNGSGKGNLLIGTKRFSVDFSDNCSAAFGPTPAGRFYAGVWVNQPSEMAVLLLTAQGGSALCTLKTSLHTDVYIRDATEAIRAISDEDYERTHPN